MKTETLSILTAIGEKGTDPTLTTITAADLLTKIGGNVKAISLDKETAVFFDIDKQSSVLLNTMNLVGTLALCGADNSGNPLSLSTIKQIAKYGKVFKASRVTKTNSTAKEVK